MKVQLKQGGNVIQQFYTFNSGGYSFKTPSLSNYTVDIDTNGLPLSVVCPGSFSRSVSLSPADSVKKFENFGMQCSGIDFGVQNMYEFRFRPTFPTVVQINAGNIALIKYNAGCGAGTPGTVTTTFTNAMTYIGPAPGALTPTSVSGNTITYHLTDLNVLTTGSLDIILETNANAVPGSSVCITTTVTAATADIMPANNSLTQCFPILNSWDPNHKDVSPETILPNNLDWLTYTIHFQNTGSDTAYLVVLRDTLSQYVDASSFQYLASSHHAVIQLDHNAMAFTFPHIDLVDSATNPPLSEGWIQYRVRANAQLPIGTQIHNTAYIYFDINPAVVTNTATTTVQQLTATCTDTTITRSVTICYGDTFYFAGTAHTAGGNFTDTLSRAGGCDSIIAHTLTISSQIMTMREDTICANSLYIFGGDTLGSPGMYMDTLSSVTGCDSIVMLMLEVHPVFRRSTYDTVCAGSSLTWHGHTLTTAGYYLDTTVTLHGCDSIVGLWLYVSPLPVVTFSWRDLIQQGYFSGGSGSDSIVYYCSPFDHFDTIALAGGYPIGGFYSGRAVFHDSISLHQAVEMDQSTDTIYYTYSNPTGCSDTKYIFVRRVLCDEFPWGIHEPGDVHPISLYPNPNTGTFTLQTSHSINSLYTITDVLGKTIAQNAITADAQNIDLHDAAPGIHTLYVKGSRPVRFTVVR